MSALDRQLARIAEYVAAHNGKRPDKLTVSWRERYRLMIELRRMSRMKEIPWRKVNAYDQWLAYETYGMMKQSQIRLLGVPIVTDDMRIRHAA